VVPPGFAHALSMCFRRKPHLIPFALTGEPGIPYVGCGSEVEFRAVEHWLAAIANSLKSPVNRICLRQSRYAYLADVISSIDREKRVVNQRSNCLAAFPVSAEKARPRVSLSGQ
jgi:hypothetical protein